MFEFDGGCQQDEVAAEIDRLRDALTAAIKVAGEAQKEWDAAPAGMKAGKLLIALAGGLPGYRADIDAIHTVLHPKTPVCTEKGTSE